MKVIGKLLGTPSVIYDGHQITFPFRKAEALFYYLLVRRQASRDELVNLLWGEVEEETAKKNLRNAIYMIRKIFGMDILESPQRSIVRLSGAVDWETDLEQFLNGKEIEDIWFYGGEFLQGFLVKDADGFEEWMFHSRENYRDFYIHQLHRAIKRAMEEQVLEQAEIYCKRLISTDALDEEAYRILMEIYCKEGQFNKGIETYNRLKEILGQELSIAPDIKTVKLLEGLLREKAIKESLDSGQNQDFYYGREQELKRLMQNYGRFVAGQGACSLIISGEAGIGKSRLVEKFLKESASTAVQIFTTYCYQAEEEFLLKPWNGIFSKLARFTEEKNIQLPSLWKNIINYVSPVFTTDANIVEINPVEKIDLLKYQAVEKAAVNILQRAAEASKIILFFEDLQWIDSMSLSLLKNVIQESQNRRIIVLATCRDGYEEKLSPFMSELVRYGRLDKIELQRFTKEEVASFARGLMPGFSFDEELQGLIYKETEGNTFFLVELLNRLKENGSIGEMSPKLKDILKSRILTLSQEAQKVLNIASVFFDKVSLEDLQWLSGKNDMELLDILEELQAKGLLKEIKGDRKISFAFTHQKLREYIYEQLSLSRRRLLHQRIARLLEGKLKQDKTDTFLYSKLIYHFKLGDQRLAALKYAIANLQEYLQFSHEIFPVLNASNLSSTKELYLNQEQAFKQLQEIGELLQEVKQEEEDTSELKALERAHLYMTGRFYIRQGEYDQGLALMEHMIEDSLKEKDVEGALKGYRQMIYYCINTQNTKAMEDYVDKALALAHESGARGEIGILLRLKGLQKVMDGRYQEGELYLEQAIVTFNSLENPSKYVLNIAAAYNFIGESKRHRQQFKEAIHYYDKAITICEERKLSRGLTIFYTNAGQAALDMGNEEQGGYYLEKALSLYEQLDSLWGYATAKAYFSLIKMRQGRYEETFRYLYGAESDASRLKNPYEMGLVLRAKAEIRLEMEENPALASVMKNFLLKDTEFYCQEGIRLLENLKGCYEVELLKELFEKKTKN